MAGIKSDKVKVCSSWLMDDRVELYLMNRRGKVYQARVWLDKENIFAVQQNPLIFHPLENSLKNSFYRSVQILHQANKSLV